MKSIEKIVSWTPSEGLLGNKYKGTSEH